MSTKTVFQIDDHFWYVGPAEAFECQLEPGIFHVPAGCVEPEPPACPQGMRPRFVGGVWIQEPWAPPPEPTPAERLAAFLREHPEVMALVGGPTIPANH